MLRKPIDTAQWCSYICRNIKQSVSQNKVNSCNYFLEESLEIWYNITKMRLNIDSKEWLYIVKGRGYYEEKIY